MADNIIHAELAQLRARVAQLETRQRSRPHGRHLRRFVPLIVVGLLVALMPLSLLAANPFNDLTGGVHDANIDAIYNAGITTGCVPNVSYCPTDLVTRQEMASFLARTAGLGANPPVANAKTVGGYAPNGLVRVALQSTTPSVDLDTSATTALGSLAITARRRASSWSPPRSPPMRIPPVPAPASWRDPSPTGPSPRRPSATSSRTRLPPTTRLR